LDVYLLLAAISQRHHRRDDESVSGFTPPLRDYDDGDVAGRLLRRFSTPPSVHEVGATILMNSREVITLVCFQNGGKCRWLPVTR
jgi:hypothetical protein